MKEFKVKTPGAELFVCEYGNPQGQPLVLVHGGPGIAGSLSELGQELKEQGRVIEYDQRGTKRSSSEGPYEIQNHLEDLRELIISLGLERPILIGHSFGGFLSLCFAATYGELISKVVVVSCAPLTQAAGKEMDERLMSRLSDEEKRRREQLLAMKSDASLSQQEKDDSDLELMRLLFRRYQFGGKAPLHHLMPRYMPAVMEANKNYMALRNSADLLQMLKKIKSPIIAFHGENDVIPPSGSLPVLSECVENFEGHLLPECGHFPWHEANAKTEFFPRLKL